MADLRFRFIEDYAGGLLNISRQEISTTGEVLSQDGFTTEGTIFVEDGSGVKSGLKLGVSLAEVVDPTTDMGIINVRYGDRTYAKIRDLRIFTTAIASAQSALSEATSVSISNLETAFQLLEDDINSLEENLQSNITNEREQIQELTINQNSITDRVSAHDTDIQTLQSRVDFLEISIPADINLSAIRNDLSALQLDVETLGTDTGAEIDSLKIRVSNIEDTQDPNTPSELKTDIIFTTDSASVASVDGDIIGSIIFKGSNGTQYRESAKIFSGVDDPVSGSVSGDLNFAVTKAGSSTATNRLRIDQQGAFSFQSTGSCIFASSEAISGGTFAVFVGRHTATTIPSGVATSYIWTNGGISNYQSNNIDLSDERDKKNIETLESTWNCVKEWNIRKYHYNFDLDSSEKRYGVIAQEVEQTCPEVITVWNEDDSENPKLGVKTQQMEWMAIRALQEAQQRIEELETRIATLEGA